MLHPVHHFAVEHFRDGNVRHRRCRRRTVPVLVVRRTPDDIAGADFLDRPAFALRPADARRDDQRLSERMRVRAPGSNVTIAPPMRAGSVR